MKIPKKCITGQLKLIFEKYIAVDDPWIWAILFMTLLILYLSNGYLDLSSSALIKGKYLNLYSKIAQIFIMEAFLRVLSHIL